MFKFQNFIFRSLLYQHFLKKYQIVLFLLALFMNVNHCNALEENSYFIGHAYGAHGNDSVPDQSLKNFLIKKPANFILFGGDVTENENDFQKFHEYFKDTNHLIVRGNHDKDLYTKIPYWKTKKIKGTTVYNLDMNADMQFNIDSLKSFNHSIIAQHYLWYLRIFSDQSNNYSLFKKLSLKLKSWGFSQRIMKYRKIPIANSMYGAKILEYKDIKQINFGKKNIYLAGDCGAFDESFPYVKSYFKENTFICSGIGSGWGNNVVSLNTLEPIFFDNFGNIISHTCKTKVGNFNNQIEFCLPINDKAKILWKKLNKF